MLVEVLHDNADRQRQAQVVASELEQDAAERFAVEKLGFIVSDRTAHMRFLRCNRKHHCVAYAKSAVPSLNHIAFEMQGVDAVMRAALQECRARTLKNITLPAEEKFTLEYVKNQPWAGYNWYKGNYTSLIQVNTDLPVSIGRALDLACHEGYPGHHTYNVLLEKNLVRDRGWVEFSIYPLNSPQSLIAEGTGNYGLHVAFTEAEKDAFERDVLFPLAGLDP